mgnify:CR=1 FL=1
MFQGVRQGSVLYILRKGENPTLTPAQVVSVSNPYAPANPQNIFAQPSVVDIQVSVNGEVTTFKEMPALSEFTASPDGTVVADNPEAMLAEVKNLHRTSQQIVESAPHHEKLLPVYESFYDILDPNLAKEREKDKRLSYLENKVSGMEGTLTDIHQLLLSNLNHTGK